jgi:hypothetical protein
LKEFDIDSLLGMGQTSLFFSIDYRANDPILQKLCSQQFVNTFAILHPVVFQFGNNQIFPAVYCLPTRSLVIYSGNFFRVTSLLVFSVVLFIASFEGS